MIPQKALITGITGQDGSYLAELLLDKGYEVHGIVRRASSLARSRLSHLFANSEIYNRALFLHYADLDDVTTIRRLLTRIVPAEIYHLAGQSHVGLSFEVPESTCEMTAMGTLRFLEIIRDLPKAARFYHACSSEIFGRPEVAPQDELTPLAPINPYGVAKAFATKMVRGYRESFGLFACNGITYNYESSRRGENFPCARSAARLRQSSWAARVNCPSANSVPSGIGEMLATTLMGGGVPSSTKRPKTSALLRGMRTASGTARVCL